MVNDILFYLTEEEKHILCDIIHGVPLQSLIHRYGRTVIINYVNMKKLADICEFYEYEFNFTDECNFDY